MKKRVPAFSNEDRVRIKKCGSVGRVKGRCQPEDGAPIRFCVVTSKVGAWGWYTARQLELVQTYEDYLNSRRFDVV